MRAVPAILVALALALTAAGCGGTDETTPIACLEGVGRYARALEGAPGDVALPGGTRISECLVRNQHGGDLATVGSAMVEVATTLNARARAEPGGAANLRLGYLLGAAQRGADRTEGVHAELIRRLGVAAGYSPDNRPLPAAFDRTYREGFDAGHDGG